MTLITPITILGKQIGANRIVPGTKIPHVCGDPTLPEKDDLALRREIVKRALGALKTDVSNPTVFVPNVNTSG